MLATPDVHDVYARAGSGRFVIPCRSWSVSWCALEAGALAMKRRRKTPEPIESCDSPIEWTSRASVGDGPTSSARGFWPRMSLAVIIGDCGNDVWSELFGWPFHAKRVGRYACAINLRIPRRSVCDVALSTSLHRTTATPKRMSSRHSVGSN